MEETAVRVARCRLLGAAVLPQLAARLRALLVGRRRFLAKVLVGLRAARAQGPAAVVEAQGARPLRLAALLPVELISAAAAAGRRSSVLGVWAVQQAPQEQPQLWVNTAAAAAAAGRTRLAQRVALAWLSSSGPLNQWPARLTASVSHAGIYTKSPHGPVSAWNSLSASVPIYPLRSSGLTAWTRS